MVLQTQRMKLFMVAAVAVTITVFAVPSMALGAETPGGSTPAAADLPAAGVDLQVVRGNNTDWPVYTALPDSSPQFNWKMPDGLQVGYLGFIATPIPQPDVKGLRQQQLWRALNDLDQMKWFVIGLDPATRSIRYATAGAPAPNGTLTSSTPAPLAEGFYLIVISGYQGKYRPNEGRQPIASGGCVLKVGNPREPEKPDYTKLDAGQMQSKVQEWVEDFFSANYRDITARKTLEWGKAQKLENGNWQIRYRYEAEIWRKDKIIQDKLFTFDGQGSFVSVQDAQAGASHDR